MVLKMKENWKEKGKYLLVLITSIAITYVLFRFGLTMILPFFFAYSLAKFLLPVTTFLKKRLHFSSTIASASATLLSVCFLCAVIFWLGCCLIEQLANFISHFPGIISQLQTGMDSVCSCCDTYFNLTSGTTQRLALSSMERMQSSIGDTYLPKLTKSSVYFGRKIIGFSIAFFLMFFSAFYFLKDWDKLYKLYKNCMFYREIHIVKEKLMTAGSAWLRTQFILFMLISLILSGGLLMLKNPYALLIGIIIALLDALPFIGSGLILVPWAIFEIAGGNYKNAVVLVALFIICQLLRELLEPKLMGNHMGIPPLYSLITVFLGLKLFGIWGVILGPMALILIQTVMREYKLTMSSQDSENL